MSARSQYKRDVYKKIIELGKQEWLLSTDGVVKALRYDKNDKQFVAKVHYKKDPSSHGKGTNRPYTQRK